MVFDLSAHIHLPGYLRFLIESWGERRPLADLTVVVHPQFAERHADVVTLAADHGIRFLALSRDEHRHRIACQRAALDSPDANPALSFADLLRGRIANEALSFDWQMLHTFGTKTEASRCLVVAIDPFLPLLAGGCTPPCPVSGIFFGARFHYTRMGWSRAQEPEQTLELRQKFMLSRALDNPLTHRLLLLDPFAAAEAERFPRGHKIRHLADPVVANRATDAAARDLREHFGIQSDRIVLLLFGHLTPRKGAGVLIEALWRVPQSMCRSLCVVFAGVTNPDYRAELEARAAVLAAARGVQFVLRFAFVPHEAVDTHFRMADWVLAPYPNHVGMSGILLLAAAAGKPVLASDFGLMGAYVKRHRLGLAVDARDPDAVADGLRRIAQGAADGIADPAAMQELADRHDHGRFGSTLMDTLLADRDL